MFVMFLYTKLPKMLVNIQKNTLEDWHGTCPHRGLEDHFSFLNGWLVGSMLIFQGVHWAPVKTKSHCHSFLRERGPPLSTPTSHAAEWPPLWGYNTRFTHMIYIYTLYAAHTRLEMCWMVVYVHLHIHIYIYILSIKMIKDAEESSTITKREHVLFCYYEHSGLAGKTLWINPYANHKLDM